MPTAYSGAVCGHGRDGQSYASTLAWFCPVLDSCDDVSAYINADKNGGNLGRDGRYNNKSSHPMDDIFLIEQTKLGNPQAFRLLVLRYQRPLFKFLSGFGLAGARVEELAQETLLRVYENLASYQSDKGASFATWLFVIAKRLALNELARSEYRYPTFELEAAMQLDNDSPSPLAEIEATQQRQQLHHSLQRVTEPFRSALVLSYLEELKLTEIAEIENCSVGTVKSRIFRGKQMLARLLQTAEAHTDEYP
jgi:RNA polymerase sigma-70 factor (ECF subfamily)